jgi:hypothetical protein
MADDRISIVAFDLASERVISLEEAYLELLTDLTGGAREAAGISPSGVIEAVPRHLFAFAEPGEGLEWAHTR